MRSEAEPFVQLLMATRNGARFIDGQLASIAAQAGVSVRLLVSDDGSSDDTKGRLAQFAERHPHIQVTVVDGPQRGFCRNFLFMACEAAPVDAPFFAFCDQDDVWHADKLQVAVAALSRFPADHPAVYFSRTRTVSEAGEAVGTSPLFSRPPGLRNALVQSIGGGNTTVFNRAARALLMRAGADLDVPSHDWWAYLAVTACGGTALYDPVPHIDYRQHGSNLVGENSSAAARVTRLRLLLAGRFERWIDQNLAALGRLHELMPPDHRDLVAAFAAARHEPSMFRRVSAIARLGLYRQTAFGNLSLFSAAALGKL